MRSTLTSAAAAAAIAVAGPLFAFAGAAAQSGQPIKIGFSMAMTGALGHSRAKKCACGPGCVTAPGKTSGSNHCC
jgi:hypothetical protein